MKISRTTDETRVSELVKSGGWAYTHRYNQTQCGCDAIEHMLVEAINRPAIIASILAASYDQNPEYVKAARAALGMTQAELAESLGVATDTVSSWEQGERNPSAPAKKLIDMMTKRTKKNRPASTST